MKKKDTKEIDQCKYKNIYFIYFNKNANENLEKSK